MTAKTPLILPDPDRFQTIAEFKESLLLGGEIAFRWEGTDYGICRTDRYCLAHADGSCGQWCDTLDEVLDCLIGSNRLREIITRADILWRNL